MTTEPKRRFLQVPEIIRLNEIIRAHSDFVLRAGVEIVQYHEGWSDERVAQELSNEVKKPVPLNSVQRFRGKHIGALTVPAGLGAYRAKGGGAVPVPLRVAVLEDKVRHLEERIAYLESQLGVGQNASKALSEELQKRREAREEQASEHASE